MCCHPAGTDTCAALMTASTRLADNEPASCSGLIPKKIIKMEDIFKLQRKDPVEEEPWVAQLSSRLHGTVHGGGILSHRAWSPTPDGHAETGPVSPSKRGSRCPLQKQRGFILC